MNKKVIKILEYAMRMENDAKEFYAYHLESVQSEDLKNMFTSLVEMEKNHYSVLKVMRDKLNVQDPPITVSWVVDNAAKEINPPILSDNSDLLSNPQAANDLSVVRLAYLMESDFELFYKNAAQQVEEPSAKEFLLELAKWESQHAHAFRIRYEEMLKLHWEDATTVVFQ